MESRPHGRELPALLLLLAATAAAFWRALHSDYVNWDDPRLVFANPWLSLPFADAWRAFWTQSIEGDYLPLPMLTYWVEVKLGGFNPVLQHGTNLALHLANVALLFGWLRLLPLPQGVRWLVCVVFALHPLQVETVLWISDRKGLLNTLLLLAALHLHARGAASRRPWPWMTGYAAAFAAASLCKATAVLLPALLLWLDLKTDSPAARPVRHRFLLHAPALGVAAAAALVRYLVMEHHVDGIGAALLDADRLLLLVALVPAFFGHYVAKVLVPANLSAVYPDFQSPAAWTAELAVAVAAGAVLVPLLVRRGTRLERFFALWFLALLLPVANLVPRGNFVNDRYAYLPIIGFVALVGLLGQRLLQPLLASAPEERVRTRAAAASLALLALALGAATRARAGVWQDSATLWSDAVARHPDSRLAWNNLAMEQRRRGLSEQALESLSRGIEQGTEARVPVSALYCNRGDLRAEPELAPLFQPALALDDYLAAIETASRPFDAIRARMRLGLLLARGGRLDDARGQLDMALSWISALPAADPARSLETEARAIAATLRP